MDGFLRASNERKPRPIENYFCNPHTFPKYFTRPERPSPFYPNYASSSPDYVKYIPTTHIPKSDITNVTSTARTKGKAISLSTSSSDSKDVPKIPPSKFQKEEEVPDKSF